MRGRACLGAHRDRRLEVWMRFLRAARGLLLSSGASDSLAVIVSTRISRCATSRRTGGTASPRGIGCGATGAEGAVSAQNQPIMIQLEAKYKAAIAKGAGV
jgi:hypothetical protein